MNFVGIDIGSTAAKTAVLGEVEHYFVQPTGWNSLETAVNIKSRLNSLGIDKDNSMIVATGYGRAAVDYANKTVTEITCHARGGYRLAGEDCTIIDVGGQDTKIIRVENGHTADFLMNDKCSAGTGRFAEIMAARLGMAPDALFTLAATGQALPISSLCTVFAESEVIGLMSTGASKQDIAAGIAASISDKVAALAKKKYTGGRIVLTGGLSHVAYFAELLGHKLGTCITPVANGRYAGAIGAAVSAARLAS